MAGTVRIADGRNVEVHINGSPWDHGFAAPETLPQVEAKLAEMAYGLIGPWRIMGYDESWTLEADLAPLPIPTIG
jgi:hypothetical protein